MKQTNDTTILNKNELLYIDEIHVFLYKKKQPISYSTLRSPKNQGTPVTGTKP